jgi:hypothetical protein
LTEKSNVIWNCNHGNYDITKIVYNNLHGSLMINNFYYSFFQLKIAIVLLYSRINCLNWFKLNLIYCSLLKITILSILSTFINFPRELFDIQIILIWFWFSSSLGSECMSTTWVFFRKVYTRICSVNLAQNCESTPFRVWTVCSPKCICSDSVFKCISCSAIKGRVQRKMDQFTP